MRSPTHTTSTRPKTMRPKSKRHGKAILVGAATVLALSTGAIVAGAQGDSPTLVPRPQASSTDATAQPAGAYVAVSPVRVLDTRPAPQGPIGVTTSAKLGANATIVLPLAGNNKIIPANATSAMLNVTIDQDASTQSFLTVWPTGEPRPTTSSNNALPGLVAANTILAKLGTDGSISIFNQQGSVNVVIDLVGYTVPLTSVEGTDGAASASSSAASTVTLSGTSPVAIPFDTAGQADGSVTRTNATTFSVASDGLYDINYKVDFGTPVAGTLAVFVNGVAQGPTSAVLLTSTTVQDTVLVKAAAGDAVQLRFTPTVSAPSIVVNSSRIIVEQTTSDPPVTTTSTTVPSSSTSSTSSTVASSTSTTS